MTIKFICAHPLFGTHKSCLDTYLVVHGSVGAQEGLHLSFILWAEVPGLRKQGKYEEKNRVNMKKKQCKYEEKTGYI